MTEERNNLIYIASLEGESVDLQLLARCFTNGSLEVIEVESENQREYQLRSGDLVLEEKHFTHVTSDGKEVLLDANWDLVAEEAERMLQGVHGIARLIRSSYQPVRIAALHKITQDGEWRGSRTIASLRKHERQYLLPSHRTGIPNLAKAWAQAGLSNERIYLALQVYGNLPITWPNLYVAYEAIAADIGGYEQMIQRKWISEERHKQFTATAHNTRDIGPGIRHGGEPRSTWDPSNAMTVGDGEAVVRRLFNHWFAEKTRTYLR